jgi:hypothetical protein
MEMDGTAIENQPHRLGACADTSDAESEAVAISIRLT